MLHKNRVDVISSLIKIKVKLALLFVLQVYHHAVPLCCKYILMHYPCMSESMHEWSAVCKGRRHGKGIAFVWCHFKVPVRQRLLITASKGQPSVIWLMPLSVPYEVMNYMYLSSFCSEEVKSYAWRKLESFLNLVWCKEKKELHIAH